MSDQQLDKIIETRVYEASTNTKSEDEIVHLAWLADGIDIWHRTNGKRGHSPADARRYVISSATRLIKARDDRIIAELRSLTAYSDGKHEPRVNLSEAINIIRNQK